MEALGPFPLLNQVLSRYFIDDSGDGGGKGDSNGFGGGDGVVELPVIIVMAINSDNSDE